MNNLIYIAQLNPIIGDIEYNKNLALKYIKEAIESNADLIIFPELFLSGYPLGDILERYPYILKQCEKAIAQISNVSENISVLMGCPEPQEQSYNNSIYYIKDSKINRIIKKSDKIHTNTNFHISFRHNILPVK